MINLQNTFDIQLDFTLDCPGVEIHYSSIIVNNLWKLLSLSILEAFGLQNCTISAPYILLFKLFTSLLVLVIKGKQSSWTSFTSEIQSLGLTFHPKLIGFSLYWIKIEFTQSNINFAADALPVAFRCIPCLVKCSFFRSNFNNVASLKGFTIFISLCLRK